VPHDRQASTLDGHQLCLSSVAVRTPTPDVTDGDCTVIMCAGAVDSCSVAPMLYRIPHLTLDTTVR